MSSFDFERYVKSNVKSCISLSLILISILSYGQNENRIWYYGPSNMGLQFAPITNTIGVLNNKYTPYSGEGCSVVQHPSAGLLLFYTNGIVAVDAYHQVMPNGSGLAGNVSSAQSGLVCPNPANCNQYYIFHNNVDMTPGSLYFSVVDMSLPGNGTPSNPRGDIVSGMKNIFLSSQVSEAQVLIPASGGDYWLLVATGNSASIMVYKVTAGGVSYISTYSTGYSLVDQRSFKFSKASGKLALLSMYESDVSLIMDFNNSTGQISNPYVIPGTPMGSVGAYHGMYDCEWSADGSKLYLSKYRMGSSSSGGKLFQYDLNNPSNPPVLIYSVSSSISYMARGLKRGPDDKIYFLYNNPIYNDTRYLGVINSPNLAGSACNFNATGFNFGTDQGNVHKFPENIAIQNLAPVAINDSASIFAGPGCFAEEVDTVFIQPLMNDADQDGNQLNISFVSSSSNGEATIMPGNVIRYINNSGFFGVDTLIYITCDNHCFSLCDTAFILLTVNEAIAPAASFLGSDLAICEGEERQLTALTASQYLWSTGAVTQSISVSIPGIYWVTVIDDSCTHADTIKVDFSNHTSILTPPNIFTPNQDGINDLFDLGEPNPDAFSIEIYDRWGVRMFTSESSNNKWDGVYKGREMPDGVYFWIARYKGNCSPGKSEVIKTGFVHLLR